MRYVIDGSAGCIAPLALSPIDFEIRTITDDEVPGWCGALNTGFLNASGDVDAEVRRPGLFLDRTWAAFAGEAIVATLRTFPTLLTVPGGESVKASAVTAVTTTATYRRQGLATRLIHAELAATVERGEAMSILIAAAWGIYGRFGYGAATEHQTWTVDASVATLRQVPQGSVELVDRDTARAVVAAVYDVHRRGHPGEMTRPERFWDVDLGILRYPSWTEPKAGFHVVARDRDGSVVGVARYEYEEKWEHRIGRSQVKVTMFVSSGPAGDALLWRHLVSIDHIAQVQVEDRGPDELVPWLLTDARHAQPTDRADFLWIRPLDVAQVLAARTYLVSGRIVLEVVDPSGFCGGRYELEGGPDGALCRPSDASPDLTLDISALSSIYLGGYRVRRLAAAGRIDEHASGAVATADAMFRSPVAPWCSTWF
ncbi:MAG: hypothetical protein QOF30_1764 [Acidimicrobiaceae bacterium]|jgi:predicted acetyltransferase|nr:hypothetical protein [Acidimicrobiaceae bacterium]